MERSVRIHSTICAGVACIGLLVGTHVTFAANSAVAVFSNTKVIDGNLNDWTKTNPLKIIDPEQVRYEAASWENIGDLSGLVHLAWNETNLYIAAEVTDDDPVAGTATSFASDALDFYIDALNDCTPDKAADMAPYQDANMDPDDFLFKVVPETVSDGVPVWEWFQVKEVPQGVIVKTKPTAKGYDIEAAIPWKVLGLAKAPTAGYTMGVNAALEDNDEQGFMIWNGTSEGWGRMTEFAPVKLTK